MSNRQTLHTLVDELPEPEIPAATRFLEYLRHPGDPLRVALDSATIDDEPLTEADRATIRGGFADRTRGETVSHEEVKRLLHDAR